VPDFGPRATPRSTESYETDIDRPRARYGSASIVNTPADAGIDSSDRAEEREFAVVKAEIRYQQVMGTPAGITQNDPSDQFRRQ
jgi:hypothetical protein